MNVGAGVWLKLIRYPTCQSDRPGKLTVRLWRATVSDRGDGPSHAERSSPVCHYRNEERELENVSLAFHWIVI